MGRSGGRGTFHCIFLLLFLNTVDFFMFFNFFLDHVTVLPILKRGVLAVVFVLSNDCSPSWKVSSVLRKAPRKPGGPFMGSVVFTGRPLCAGFSPRGWARVPNKSSKVVAPLEFRFWVGGQRVNKETGEEDHSELC